MSNDDVIVEIQCAVCGKRSKVNTTHPCDNCNATKCHSCCGTYKPVRYEIVSGTNQEIYVWRDEILVLNDTTIDTALEYVWSNIKDGDSYHITVSCKEYKTSA